MKTLKRNELYKAVVTRISESRQINEQGELLELTRVYVKYENGLKDRLVMKSYEIEELLEITEVEEVNELIGKEIDVMYKRWQFTNNSGKEVDVTKGYVQYRNFTFED